MVYRCPACGYETAKWMGFCPQCRQGGLREIPGATGASAPVVVRIAEAASGAPVVRLGAGIGEVDRVLGGGLVAGAAVVLGGEPGVGKSTLLLQLASSLTGPAPALLVAAEESAAQVGMRARRLGLGESQLLVAAERDVEAIIAAVERVEPGLVVVDSVQAITAAGTSGSAGSVSQVRESGDRLVAMARRRSIPLVLVGHVTKDGSLAGPKVLEHMVDVVLMLDGDDDGGLRLLRCMKNRHGPVDRVGVFEMTGGGLAEVPDPSARFVGRWAGSAAGTVLYPAVAGRRSVLVEVQALVTATNAPQPRRSVKGVDAARVHQLLAVLERHAGLGFRDREVYVSVVGGMKVAEPGVDLAVALALASSRTGVPLGRIAAVGEVGLTGELRSVGRMRLRTEEAHRLGIEDVVSGDERSGGLVACLLERGLSEVPEPRSATAA